MLIFLCYFSAAVATQVRCVRMEQRTLCYQSSPISVVSELSIYLALTFVLIHVRIVDQLWLYLSLMGQER